MSLLKPNIFADISYRAEETAFAQEASIMRTKRKIGRTRKLWSFVRKRQVNGRRK